MNIKSDFEEHNNNNNENNEDEEISGNELLSSYNSESSSIQNPGKIYQKKKGNKIIKNKLNHEFEKINTYKKKNKKFNSNNF